MNQLNSLLQSLQIRVVVIIENEFTTVDVKEALSKTLLLNNTSWNLLFQSIQKHNTDVAQTLKDFCEYFSNIENHNFELQKQLLSTGDIEEYLKQIDADKTQYENTLKALDKKYDSLKHLFLRYGICNTPPNYSNLLNILNDNYVKIIYAECPVPNNYDNFYNVVKSAVHNTDSRFCLAVVDKIFGGVNTGEEFIMELSKNQQNQGLSILSFILTSKTNETSIIPIEKNDYFTREISKRDDDVIGTIEKYTAQCANAILFENFSESLKKGADEAFKISMKSENTISNILSKANYEGTSPYDAINNWYQLVTQFYSENDFLQDIKYTVALSQFYGKKASEADSKIEELSEISRFEIYDFKVNEKHLPIANGDIFIHKDKYYLLIGQQCDLSLRLKNKRNYSLAEFLELEVSSRDEPKTKNKRLKTYKKISIDMSETGSKRVHLKKFNYDTKKRIAVPLMQSKFFHLDFRVVDICMTNSEGLCLLPNELSGVNFILLPENKKQYVEQINKTLKKIQSIKKKGMEEVDMLLETIESNHLIKITDFEEKNGILSYPIQRIARIKPKFMNLISEEITDYKSRIALDYFEENE